MKFTGTILAVLLALASCGGPPPGGEPDAGLDGGPDGGHVLPLPSCAVAGPAWAGQLAAGDTANLVGGPAATARPGDFFLRNEQVRLVVEQPGHHFSAIPRGGNLIDADVVRAGDEPGADELGEVAGFLDGLVYVVLDDLTVLDDGSSGQGAALHGAGHLEVLEALPLVALLYDAGFGPALEQVWADAQALLANASAEVTYLVCPGEAAMRVRVALHNNAAPGTPAVNASVASILAKGAEATPFVRGFGFGPISATEAFVTPRYHSKVLGTVGRDVAYALRPYRFYDASGSPEDLGDSSEVCASGLTLTVFGEPAPLAMLSPTSRVSPFTIKPGAAAIFEFLFGVGRDLAEAQAAVTLDSPHGSISGSVSMAGADPLPPDTRVAVFNLYDPTDPESTKLRTVVSSMAVVGGAGEAMGTYSPLRNHEIVPCPACPTS